MEGATATICRELQIVMGRSPTSCRVVGVKVSATARPILREDGTLVS